MNKINPTHKQKTAFKLKLENPDKSFKEVMLESGYEGKSVLNPKQNLYETRGWQVLIDEYKNELIKQGLTPEYIAKKLKKLVDSEKEDISIKAINIVREDVYQEKKDIVNQSLTINYHALSQDELNSKLDTLLQDIAQLKK